MTRVKKRKNFPNFVGKNGNRMAITHFSRLIGKNFSSFFHRPIFNSDSLKKIDRKNRQKIHSKILTLSAFPNVHDIKKLTNFEPAYRFRVGDYRILFDVSGNTIEIGRVLHRKDSYK